MRSFFCPYFPSFGLNTEIRGLEKTPYLNTVQKVTFQMNNFQVILEFVTADTLKTDDLDEQLYPTLSLCLNICFSPTFHF